ncbi:MAG: hypothetical protein GY845_08105 [Planctomycetes bacterium]|nr:hypothetical protein [Planctomycetota bacterium]
MMKKKHFYTAVILLLFLAVGIQPVLAIIQVPSETTDINGATIATYIPGSNTYTLTADVAEALFIEQSGLTLEGNGRTITGPGPGNTGVGVDINGKSGITVNNLTITGFEVGIRITNSNLLGTIQPEVNTLENNIITTIPGDGNSRGIRLLNANKTNITGNNISNSFWGIHSVSSGDAIIGGWDYSNSITGNTVTGNEGGIWLEGSSYNTIYNNNFIDNIQLQAYVSGSSNDNNYDYNYWSDYTGADTDGDGIGETAYTFTGGQDDFPWVVENGWSIPVNQSPITEAGPDQIVDQDSSSGASVTLDGSGSSDDGQIQPLTYTWAWAGGGSATGVNPAVTLPLGTTTVTLTVYDGILDDTDTVDITVQSVTPPEEVVEDIIDYIIAEMYVPKQAEKEVGKAVKELNKAIKEFNKGKTDKAIKKIAKAVKSLKKAQKKGADTQDVIDELNDLVQGL